MYNGLLKSFLITLAAFAAVFLLFASSWSADWEVSPYVTIIEEYDDNIDFSVDEKKRDDWITYVKPRVIGTYQTDRFRMFLNSRMGAEKYLEYDKFDTIDHNHRINLTYDLSPTFRLSTGGYFRKDTTLETELDKGMLVPNREDRQKFGGNLDFDYAFSTRLSCSGGWTRRYTKYPAAPENFHDGVIDTLKLAPCYVLGPRTRLFLKMAYTDTEYERELDPSSTHYNISPSFRHDFAEDFYVSGEAGYLRTEHKTKHTERFVFNLLFHRDWERVSIELLVRRDQYQYSTNMGDSERDSVTFNGIYRLSARFRSSFDAAFYRNRWDDSEYDSDYYKVSPALSYDLTPTITLRGSVDYTEYDYKDINRADKERFRARLFLNFTWPRLLSGD